MAQPVIVVGTYENRHRAELDYEALSRDRAAIHAEKVYAIGLVERKPDGTVKLVNHLEPDTEYGTIGGMVIGGLLGLLYPPIVLATAVAGSGIGRAAAHLWRGISRADIKELGEAVDAGGGAVVVIAGSLPGNVDGVLAHADSVAHRTMAHKHEDIEALVAELRAEHEAGPQSASDPEPEPESVGETSSG